MSDDTDWTLISFKRPESRNWSEETKKIIEKHAAPKGACPKCGKRIGRGVAGHIRACKGDK